MAFPVPSSPKAVLRRHIRSLPPPRTDGMPMLLERVASWLSEHPGLSRIALFHPLPDEPDLTPLVSLLPDRTWCLPRVDSDRMSFHLVSSLKELQPGAFGILEPSPSSPEVHPSTIHAFLCPGLAFDRQGGRLGRGKGYYDKALSLSPDGVFIGVGFGERLVPDTHPESHDIRMHHVFTT